MVGYQQKRLALCPRVVLGNHGRQFGNAAGKRIVLQNQVQYCHKMALTTAKTAMQITGFTRPRLQGAIDKAQCIVKADLQFRRHNVFSEGLFSAVAPPRQAVGQNRPVEYAPGCRAGLS